MRSTMIGKCIRKESYFKFYDDRNLIKKEMEIEILPRFFPLFPTNFDKFFTLINTVVNHK